VDNNITDHEFEDITIDYYYSQQSLILQALISSPSPGQSAPPYEGVGDVHVLILFCTPPPHDREHVDHSDQPDQSPFPGKAATKSKY